MATNSFLSGGPGRTGGIPVSEADSILAEVRITIGSEAVALERCLGRILAEEILADRPVPAFDRVCMDGYALQVSAFDAGRKVLRVVGEARAGQPRTELVDPSACLEVMTGSVLPMGADAVVAVEKTRRTEEGVEILVDRLEAGANIHRAGRDRRAGDLVVGRGVRLGPGEVAALASVGAIAPMVMRFPRVSVVSTGDELVPPDKVPESHQIRQSNAWGIAAALERSGFGRPRILHLPDDPCPLAGHLRELLAETDLLVLSGGVSMGRHDLVPSVLTEIGVHRLLHGIAQQPGGPVWMGVSSSGGLVAGLPGNPVSSLVCLVRHVLPVIERSSGVQATRTYPIRMGQAVRRQETKTRFVPVGIERGMAFPSKVDGSGDWAGLVGSAGVVEVPSGGGEIEAGSELEFFPW